MGYLPYQLVIAGFLNHQRYTNVQNWNLRPGIWRKKNPNQGAVSRWVGPRLTEIPTTDPVEQKHDQ